MYMYTTPISDLLRAASVIPCFSPLNACVSALFPVQVLAPVPVQGGVLSLGQCRAPSLRRILPPHGQSLVCAMNFHTHEQLCLLVLSLYFMPPCAAQFVL
jgi:hypothetical protein